MLQHIVTSQWVKRHCLSLLCSPVHTQAAIDTMRSSVVFLLGLFGYLNFPWKCNNVQREGYQEPSIVISKTLEQPMVMKKEDGGRGEFGFPHEGVGCTFRVIWL